MITPFLNLHGKCEEVVHYYQTVFGFEEPRFLKFNMTPTRGYEVPIEFEDKVMFTFFKISNTRVMACDYYPGLASIPGQSISLNVIHENEIEMLKWFEHLSSEGIVGMKPQVTAWAPLYASCTDKYGIVWQFSLNQ